VPYIVHVMRARKFAKFKPTFCTLQKRYIYHNNECRNLWPFRYFWGTPCSIFLLWSAIYNACQIWHRKFTLL